MKRLFLMLMMLAFVASLGCQETPPADPEFVKKPVDMDKLQPTQEKLQKAPPE